MADKKPGPDTPSGDYNDMIGYWTKAQTMLDGADAMRKAGETYLPKFPKEAKTRYEYRRKNAKFTNVFRDICENLASKPFAKMTGLADASKVSQEIKDFVTDVDGAGNNIHVFAGSVFFFGIAKALDWIFVDYTKVPTGASLAAEKTAGARPYWLRIKAENILAIDTAMIEGREEPVHLRIYEPTKVRVGYTEVVKERVREYNRAEVPSLDGGPSTYLAPVWVLWEKQKDPNSDEWIWVAIDKGAIRIGVIPIIPFLTGRRKGRSWCINPPMADAADTQVEHYQQETNLKLAKERSCFPMLVGAGIAAPKGKDGKAEEIEVGPNVVLYAPMDESGNHGDWNSLEPGAQSLKFLAEEIDATEKQLRELGRQPLTANSGNLTVVTTEFAAQKGNSAVQAWALGLKDALERALQLTAKWLNDETSKPEVFIYTDFDVAMKDGTSMDRLVTMRKNRDLTQKTLWSEAVRRGELAADFNGEEEAQALLDEGPDPLSPEDALAAAGVRQPIRVAA